MIGSYFLPARWRNNNEASTGRPNFVSRQITPVLLSLSRRACVHPIYTIVSVAILASTTYLGLLESSLFDRQTGSSVGHVDFNSLLAGSKNLYTGLETGWKWHVEENGKHHDYDEVWHKHPFKGRHTKRSVALCSSHLRVPRLCVRVPSNRTASSQYSDTAQFLREASARIEESSFIHLSGLYYRLLPSILARVNLPLRLEGNPNLCPCLSVEIQ